MKISRTNWMATILLGGMAWLVAVPAAEAQAPVARRHVRRAVVVTTVVASNAAASNQQVAAANQAAAAASAQVPIGMVVTSLPGGCTVAGALYNCSGVHYKAYYQGTTLVYEVVPG